MLHKLVIFGIFLGLCFNSCDHVKEVASLEVNKESDYCINYIHSNPDSILLSEGDFSLAKSLFDFNKLDYHQLQFYRVETNAQVGYYHVRCNQFVNGLKIFTEEVIFHFKPTKIYSSLSGELITQINLDTMPLMTQSAAIEKYLAQLKKDTENKIMGDVIKQECFDLEFGYYDLNASISYAEPNYTKAWKVSLKDREYPYAYINDMTSTTIGYDNGIKY